tara:strand:- start:3559 stop:3774 length:216 start_codon:yes stop_codon:yes gene_type:complete
MVGAGKMKKHLTMTNFYAGKAYCLEEKNNFDTYFHLPYMEKPLIWAKINITCKGCIDMLESTYEEEQLELF